MRVILGFPNAAKLPEKDNCDCDQGLEMETSEVLPGGLQYGTTPPNALRISAEEDGHDDVGAETPMLVQEPARDVGAEALMLDVHQEYSLPCGFCRVSVMPGAVGTGDQTNRESRDVSQYLSREQDCPHSASEHSQLLTADDLCKHRASPINDRCNSRSESPANPSALSNDVRVGEEIHLASSRSMEHIPRPKDWTQGMCGSDRHSDASSVTSDQHRHYPRGSSPLLPTHSPSPYFHQMDYAHPLPSPSCEVSVGSSLSNGPSSTLDVTAPTPSTSSTGVTTSPTGIILMPVQCPKHTCTCRNMSIQNPTAQEGPFLHGAEDCAEQFVIVSEDDRSGRLHHQTAASSSDGACNFATHSCRLCAHSKLDSTVLSVTSFNSLTSDGPMCRICHEGALSTEDLIEPCHCAGSLGYQHKKCLEQWLQARGEDACELCDYHFRTQRKGRPFSEWIGRPERSHDRRNILTDLGCFALLTPLVCVSTWLCLNGAYHYLHYYEERGWEGVGLISLASVLILIYLFWSLMSLRYHCTVWRSWRRQHQLVNVIMPNSPSKMEHHDHDHHKCSAGAGSVDTSCRLHSHPSSPTKSSSSIHSTSPGSAQLAAIARV